MAKYWWAVRTNKNHEIWVRSGETFVTEEAMKVVEDKLKEGEEITSVERMEKID